MLRNIKASMAVAVFSVTLMFTLSCWAGPVDDLYGDEYGDNLAFGKVVLGSAAKDPAVGDQTVLVDGDLCQAGAAACYTMSGKGAGLRWIQVDLGEKMWVDTVVVWHYYIDSRTYKDGKTAVSSTGEFSGEELVIFDSAKEGTYVEKPEGHVIQFKPTQARYIRDWVNGSDKNLDSHWIEMAAFSAQGPGAVSLQDKLATSWAKVKCTY